MLTRRERARDAAAFLAAAAVALFGSAALFKAGGAGSALAPMSGGAPVAAHPGIPVLVMMILFGVTGLILVMLAAKEILSLRRP